LSNNNTEVGSHSTIVASWLELSEKATTLVTSQQRPRWQHRKTVLAALGKKNYSTLPMIKASHMATQGGRKPQGINGFIGSTPIGSATTGNCWIFAKF
jgi:hypothetical protein